MSWTLLATGSRNFPSKHHFTGVKQTNGIIVHKQLQMEAFYRCKKSQSSQDIY
jgi:hypothetical protein